MVHLFSRPTWLPWVRPRNVVVVRAAHSAVACSPPGDHTGLVLPTALVGIGPRCWIKSREDAIQVLGVPVVLPKERSGIGEMDHILMEVRIVLQEIVNNRAQEHDITSGANRNV